MPNIEKSIEISQDINNYWQLGDLEEKRKIQKLVFPEGIVVDTTNRTYLTSKVNSLFLAKSQFKRTSEGVNKKLPINSDEESSLVDYMIEISNLDLMRDLIEVVDYEVTPFWAFNTDMHHIMPDRLVTKRRSRP